MQWTLCLFPQSRQDPSDPAPSISFEKRLQEIMALCDDADQHAAKQETIKQADRRIGLLLHSMSNNFSMVGQPSTRQLTRFWFLRGEIKLALGDHQSALDALDCCAGLVAENPARDQVAVNFLRAEVAGASWRFRKSLEGYAAVIEQIELNQLLASDFAVGDLRTLSCYVHLQRAEDYMALGYFEKAQTDMRTATRMLDQALVVCGIPRPDTPHQDGNPHLHPALVGYAQRLRWLVLRGEPTTDVVMRNWLELCLKVPITYAAVEAWHTRLFAQERGANGLLASFYDLLIACGHVSTLLPLWSLTTTLLYYRAAQIAIIGHDVAHLQRDQVATVQLDSERTWLQRTDQALVNIFDEHDYAHPVPRYELDLRIELERHGLWVRQQFGYPGDFLGVPDLIDIGSSVRLLLQEAIMQGKTWGAARCTQLLGYIALALGDDNDAKCYLHDALLLFEQAHGDIFYPHHEELRRIIDSLDT